ncbi:hypothetical protein Aph01nite_28540 [Acrocarpospora phusangensis]|uniref:Uncharacterized protein n=1 Tax=Acrocarpospora phusangensis TaxID=1070424 RepID=A0A919UJZ8_9ACTN|nr:hypothetical protein [Acrocarpospora phusangensis]GIH24544.1 hypothetical protein Aph01nite_28540 [Acrocarpospora phusangensis]
MIFERNEGAEEDDATAFYDLLYGSVPPPTPAESLAMFEETMNTTEAEPEALYEDFEAYFDISVEETDFSGDFSDVGDFGDLA